MFSKATLITFIIGGIGGILFWGGFHTAMEVTNTLTFCTSCHEMDTVYEEYSQTVHYENNSGVRAICSDCHVPKTWAAKVVRKIQATKELYHKAIGSIDTPEKFEAKRLHLANNVWRAMKQTDSRECRNCHAFETMTMDTQRNVAQFWHPVALDEGFTCIDCHKGIAHHLPDFTPQIQAAQVKLDKQRGLDKSAKVRYASSEMALHDGVDGKTVGKLMPGAPVKVQEQQGDWLKISLQGEEMYGDASELYTSRQQRVAVAQNLQLQPSYPAGEALQVDPETRIHWRQAEVQAWVKTHDLVSDLESLWAYGETLYKADCNRCHALFPPSRFNADEWHHHLRNMRRYTQLNSQQFAVLKKYLQLKD